VGKKLETFGSRKDDKLHIIKRDLFWQSFFDIFKDGERLKLTIEKIYSRRSNPQNRYYWGVILDIILTEVLKQGNEMSKEQLHEECLKMFAPKKEIHNKEGEVLIIPMRSKEMNKSQFSDYSFDVCKWGAEFWGVYIPEPGEQTEIFNQL